MDHFSICACHPCAGAMLIFSVSFQFYQMSPKGQSSLAAFSYIKRFTILFLHSVGYLVGFQLEPELVYLILTKLQLEVSKTHENEHPTKHKNVKKTEKEMKTSWQVRMQKMRGKLREKIRKKFGPFLDLCVSSLRRGHANLLCIVPILSDVPEGTINLCCFLLYKSFYFSVPKVCGIFGWFSTKNWTSLRHPD